MIPYLVLDSLECMANIIDLGFHGELDAGGFQCPMLFECCNETLLILCCELVILISCLSDQVRQCVLATSCCNAIEKMTVYLLRKIDTIFIGLGCLIVMPLHPAKVFQALDLFWCEANFEWLRRRLF